MIPRKPKSAFTLVELMMAIAIVGILSLLVFYLLNQGRVKARNSRVQEEVSGAGRSIEAFKIANDSKIPIVQQPYYPPNPSQTLVACFAATGGNLCYPSNAVYINGNNGFTDYLFSGQDSTMFNLRVPVSAGPTYGYFYTTQDCSYDSLATSGNLHKLSNFSSYIISGTISPDGTGSSNYDFWVRDGSAGQGTDADVPLFPLWNPQPLTAYNATQSTCRYNYP